METLSKKIKIKKGREGHFPSLINIYKNPTENIKLNYEILNTFPLGSGRRQNYLLSPLLFKMVLKGQSFARAEEEIKVIGMGKEEIKLLLITDDATVYVRKTKEST